MSDAFFYVSGGTLRQDARSYVEREADANLLAALRAGEFCYVLTSRQMGKSSLMVRTATQLRADGFHVAVLDLTAIGQNLTPDQWYDGLIIHMGRQLGLDAELEDFWHSNQRLGPAQRLFAALRDVVLERRPGRLVIFVDELDMVTSLPFSTDEFFAAIRESFHRRLTDPRFERVCFCLLGVATPSDLIRDPRITPFNVGRRIVLSDFSSKEARALTAGLQAPNADRLLDRILFWTNGHPYLTQRLCGALAAALDRPKPPRAHPSLVDRLANALFIEPRAREADDNLLFVRQWLLRDPERRSDLLTLYSQVRSGRPPIADDETDPSVSILRLSGVARAERGVLKVRNRIYERAFSSEWIRANLPDAELRRQREAYRNGLRRASSLAALIVIVISLLAGYARWQTRRAKAANLELSRVSADALIAQAKAGRFSGISGQRFAGLQALRQAAAISPLPAIRNEIIACLALTDLRPAESIALEPSAPSLFAVNARLSRFAWVAADGRVFASGFGAAEEPAPVEARLPSRPTSLALDPGGRVLALISPTNNLEVVSLFDLDDRIEIGRLTNATATTCMTFSDEKRLFATGNDKGEITVLALAPTGATRRAQIQVDRKPTTLRFAPGGAVIAMGSLNSLEVRLIDWAEDREKFRRLTHRGVVRDLAWSPDGTALATACADEQIYVWNPQTGSRTVLSGHDHSPERVAFNHAGSQLASASADGSLRLWDPFLGRPLVRIDGADPIAALAFSPDDFRLGCAVDGRRLRLWDVFTAPECKRFFVPSEAGLHDRQVAFSPDGALLMATSQDGAVLWRVADGKRLATVPAGALDGARFHPATGELVTSGFYGLHRFAFRTVDLPNLRVLRIGPARAENAPPGPGRLALSGDGELLAVAQADRVTLFRPQGFDPLAALHDAEDGIRAVALSPDCRWVAAANWKARRVRVWDATTREQVFDFPVEGQAWLAFAPNGLVTGDEREYRLWDLDSGETRFRWKRRQTNDRPGPIGIDPQGGRLALAATRNEIDLIDLATGAAVATLAPPEPSPVTSLEFSPDASRLAAGTERRVVFVWDLNAIRGFLRPLNLDLRPSAPLPPPAPKALPPTRVVLEKGPFESRDQPYLIESEAKLRALTEAVEAGEADLPRHFFERGRLRWEFRDFESAASDFQSSLDLAPNQAEVLLWRAAALKRLDRLAESIASFEACLALEPGNVAANSELAEIYLSGPSELRNAKRGTALAERAYESAPDDYFALYRFGIAKYRAGDHRASLELLHRAVEKGGSRSIIGNLFHQSMNHARLGEFELARQLHDRALDSWRLEPSLGPDHPGYLRFQAEAASLLR